MGFGEADLQKRVDSLNKLLSDTVGCASDVSYDHIHKGKRDSRELTKVTLINFRSNSDREKAFLLLKDKSVKDSSGSALSCKRARTMQQKNRSDVLFKAEELINKSCSQGERIKIDFKNRCVTCNSQIAFEQDRESIRGNFVGDFTQLHF